MHSLVAYSGTDWHKPEHDYLPYSIAVALLSFGKVERMRGELELALVRHGASNSAKHSKGPPMLAVIEDRAVPKFH